MALQAGQKAWELRQAAHGAGDAKAREEILAKAINKEIEAESFGKAAKYTQSGAFQGLAAGAGLGVRPGVTLGKVTGAIVGGTVSTVTGLLGGGIGSVYGAMNGPMWDLGEMAAHGVQGVVGDWLPDWAATSSQKKALEKMVMQTKDTQAPTKEELEQMKAEAPDEMPHSWYADMTSYIPSMPKMPNMPNMKGAGSAMGLGGLGGMFGGQKKAAPMQRPASAPAQGQKPQRSTASKPSTTNTQMPSSTPKESPKPKEAPKPKELPSSGPTIRSKDAPAKATGTAGSSSSAKTSTKPTPKKLLTPQNASRAPSVKAASSSQSPPKMQSQETKNGLQSNAAPAGERKKPRKLATNSGASSTGKSPSGVKKAPRKLEARKAASVST